MSEESAWHPVPLGGGNGLIIANRLLFIHLAVLGSFSCSHTLPTFLLYFQIAFPNIASTYIVNNSSNTVFHYKWASLSKAEKLVLGSHCPVSLV